MSRLYGSLDADASQTSATRRAHKHITGHVRGWNVGVEVRAYVNADNQDVFEVYRTGGSNGGAKVECVARIVDGEPTTLLPYAWGDAARAEQSASGAVLR